MANVSEFLATFLQKGDRVLVRRCNGDEFGTVSHVESDFWTMGGHFKGLVHVTLDRSGRTFPFLAKAVERVSETQVAA